MGQQDSRAELYISADDCETLCPPCPTESLRDGKTFQVQIGNLPSSCTVEFTQDILDVVQCNEEVDVLYDSCEQPVDITLCEGTSSEQTISCCLTLDYLQLKGDLELLFNIGGICDSDCLIEPKVLMFHAVEKVNVDELCYYCVGTRPTITNGDLCNYFSIVIDSVSPTGLVTYTVQFLGCPSPL
jgi:hypothetical protein